MLQDQHPILVSARGDVTAPDPGFIGMGVPQIVALASNRIEVRHGPYCVRSEVA